MHAALNKAALHMMSLGLRPLRHAPPRSLKSPKRPTQMSRPCARRLPLNISLTPTACRSAGMRPRQPGSAGMLLR